MKIRTAARALLIDREKRSVLLIEFWLPDSHKHIWITPGGGVEPNESLATAVRREVHEETGLTTFELGPHVWSRTHRFQFLRQEYKQTDHIFLVWTTEFVPTMTANPDTNEADHQTQSRWWTAEQIYASDALFAPRKLGHYLQEILGGNIPTSPIDVGV